MHPPIAPRDRRFGPLGTLLRALLFATAMVLGCGSAIAAAAVDDKAKAVVETPSKAADPTATITAPASTTAADATDAKTNSEASAGKRSPRRRAHIQLGDDEFDSFSEAMHSAPWLIGMAFLVVSSIFLTPIILLIGIIWYKLRKTRLQNDAVLKLAERGSIPSAQAVDAVLSGVPPQAVAEMPSSAAPTYQQAIVSRRHAVWSDLRKGVILTAIGLAFVFYALVDSGAASWLGLVLMFLGLGYTLLWWFEDRHLQRRETGVGVDVGKS